MSVTASPSWASPPRSWPREGRWIRPREPADCALRWRGAGALAFAGAWAPGELPDAARPSGGPRGGSLFEVGPCEVRESPSETETSRSSPGASSALGRALDAYRRHEGWACLVLQDSRFAVGGGSAGGDGWIGEDGGPGRSIQISICQCYRLFSAIACDQGKDR